MIPIGNLYVVVLGYFLVGGGAGWEGRDALSLNLPSQQAHAYADLLHPAPSNEHLCLHALNQICSSLVSRCCVAGTLQPVERRKATPPQPNLNRAGQ